MLPGQRTPARILVAALLAGASACSDSTAPVAKLPDGAALAAGANNEKVKIKTMRLSANTLRVNGTSVNVEFTVGNSGVAIPSGISVRAEIVQGTASRQAIPLTSTTCLSGDPSGFLPNGNCDMTLPASASNLEPGTGTLSAGLATFVLHVYQAAGGGLTELANKTTGITLVDKPSISSLTLASTTLAIDGPGTNYSVSLLNPSGTLQNVLLQGLIIQGTTERAGGGLMVTCGAPIGNLPNGTCTIAFGTSASNSVGGGGTLMPGPAQFKLQLIQADGVTSTTFDERVVDITLVSSAPTIESVEFASTQLVIGATAPYTVKMKNPGFPVSPVLLQGEIVQDTPNGTVRRGTTAGFMQCGQATGILPTTGTGVCTMQLNAVVPGPGPSGTLVPGLARFVAHLIHRQGPNADVELDTKTVEVSLVANASIASINPNWTFIPLGSGFTAMTATLENNGASLTGISIQGWISQPSGARRAAGGTDVNCSGAAATELPAGTCTTPGDIVAVPGDPAGGTGTLVLGPATYELELRQFSGGVLTILDRKTIPITLVPSTPSIVSLQLTSTTIRIGGGTTYSATIMNPTSTNLTGVALQGSIEQGSTTVRPAGGTSAGCVPPSPGLVPPGPCVVNFSINISNAGLGTGMLVPGAATYRLDMWVGSTLVDTKLVPVTLTSSP